MLYVNIKFVIDMDMLENQTVRYYMRYVIFSFEDGDYLCDNQGQLLIFESRGLAYQYMQINYHSPLPIQKTKRIIHYPNFYHAPFKVHKVCQREAIKWQRLLRLYVVII